MFAALDAISSNYAMDSMPFEGGCLKKNKHVWLFQIGEFNLGISKYKAISCSDKTHPASLLALAHISYSTIL